MIEKVAQFSPKIAQKVAKSYITWKLYDLKWP